MIAQYILSASETYAKKKRENIEARSKGHGSLILISFSMITAFNAQTKFIWDKKVLYSLFQVTIEMKRRRI